VVLEALHGLELLGLHVGKLVDAHPEGLLALLKSLIVRGDAGHVVAPHHEAVEVLQPIVRLVELGLPNDELVVELLLHVREGGEPDGNRGGESHEGEEGEDDGN